MKKNRIIGIGMIAIAVLTLSWYFTNRFSYSKELPFYSVEAGNHDTLTIGVIGDSWVAGGKLDSILHFELLEKGFENKVLSSGSPGAKSRLIYQNIFKEDGEDRSSKFIVEKDPDYCIVLAGVNDAASQMGSRFYSYHMILIIRTLLHYGIKPVIVTCPEFGVRETIEDMNVFSKYRNIVSAYFNNHGEIYNIQDYRRMLSDELDAENLKDSIILVDFDKVCSDYHKCPDYYANTAHLNKTGSIKLGRVIINELAKELSPAEIR
ncbi:MAG: SGNH/GDSL hydrolase family protein [Chitinophagaceae bacterium]|nr:SGNH/GDSL hydrolase family protein [Chitinophagaceae bacterium]